jgi:hypothetical protein
MRYIVRASVMLTALCLSICGGACTSSSDRPSSPPSTGSSTTWSPGATVLDPLAGVVGGDVGCPWLDDGASRFYLRLPEGSTVERSDEGIEIRDPNHEVVGHTGERVEVVGGALQGASAPDACDSEAVTRSFAVGAFEP